MKRSYQLQIPPKPSDSALVLNGARTCLSIVGQSAREQWQGYQQVLITDGAWDDFSQQCESHFLATSTVRVLGDGDSIKQRPKDFIDTPDQNATDFEKALRYARSRGAVDMDVFWASGGEMDHFLGNLSVASHYATDMQLHFFDEQQCYFFLHNAKQTTNTLCLLTGVLGRTISLYPFPEACVSSQGLKYPLNALRLTLHQQQSLRNQACSNEVVLRYRGALWVFVSL